MLAWRTVQRCDHDEYYPGVCDFCLALAMAEALIEEDPEFFKGLRFEMSLIGCWLVAERCTESLVRDFRQCRIRRIRISRADEWGKTPALAMQT
jgi:hypothetical protein